MARLIIDTGTEGNAATGDTLRTAMTKANTNFAELYTDLAATTSSNGNLTNEDTNGDVKIFANGTGIVEIDRLSLNNTTISSLDTNADISIQPNGTGDVLLSALRVNGTTLDSSDSTKITIAEAVDVTGVLTASTSIETPTITRTGDLELDVSGSIYLDADAGVIYLQDGTAGTYGQFVRAGSNDLTIASGSTQALIFTGANAAFQGTLSVAGGSTLDGVTITDNTITSSASNADLELSAAGSGEVTTDTDFKLISGTPFLKIQRTDNANVPGIDFLGQAGTSGAKILFDGTGGTANELIFQTFTVAGGLAEAFRVQGGGAKVTGTLDIDGGITITDNKISSAASNANLQIDASGTGAIELLTQKVIMANLPTSDPGVAGQLYNDSGTLKVSAG